MGADLRDEGGTSRSILHELKHHAPFTFFGALAGIVVALIFVKTSVPRETSQALFAVFHPAHVFFSALVTTAMYRLGGKRRLLPTLLIGYVGAVGIGTLSDSLIPYLGELILNVHDEHVHAEVHIGFIHEWYLVNPLAFLGIAVACWRPATKLPHAGHVLLSTGASLFHMLMALREGVSTVTLVLIPVFLFVAVWAPCCTSDIVFPMLFRDRKNRTRGADEAAGKEGTP